MNWNSSVDFTAASWNKVYPLEIYTSFNFPNVTTVKNNLNLSGEIKLPYQPWKKTLSPKPKRYNPSAN